MNKSICSLRSIILAVLSASLLAGAAFADSPLTLGATITGTLDTPGAQARFTFTGTAGQRLVYDALDADFLQINATLLNPEGTAIWGVNSDSDVPPFTLAESGSYTLVIDGSGSTVGPYAFRLLDAVSQAALPLDTIVGDTLSPGFSAKVFQFSGTTGQHLYFHGLGANSGGQWYLYGPNNTAVGGAGIGADFEVTLGETGDYVVVLYGNSANPVPYSFQVVNYTLNSQNLALGTTITGTISKPGNQELFTFTGTPGQRVIYDALDADNLQINVRLLSPSGVVIWERNSDSDIEPFSLVQPGTYTLVLDGIGAVTGPFKFRLLDVGSQPALPLNTIVTQSIDPGLSAQVYRLDGTAGEHLYFDGLGANAGATWSLYGPNNVAIVGAGIGADFETTLTQTGAYLVVIWGNGANPVPSSFQVVTPVAPVGALALGTTVTGTVAAPGEQHLYTFPGSVGQRIYYDTLDLDSEQIYCRLIAPSGVLVWDFINQSSDSGPVTLLENGTYTLLIDGSGATTGDFRFRVLDLASATPLSLGATTSGTLNPASVTVAYQVNGTAGQRLNFDNVSATLTQASWRLISPFNQTLVQQGITTDLGDVVLPVTGTYLLLIEGASDNATSLQYNFIVSDHSDAPVAAAGLGDLHSGTIAAGQQDTNSFTAPAGLWVYFDSQDRTGAASLTAELRDPLDAIVFSVNASVDSGPWVLPRSGTYHLVIKGGGNTGTYHYRLLDLVGGIPTLTLNATVSANLDPGYRTDVYQFAGHPGQRLIYDALENDFANVSVRLLAPDGQVRYVNVNSDSDVAPFTLATGGTYRLFFESQLATPATYTFRVLDADAQAILTFNAPISPTIDPGLGISAYRFEGTPGQRLYFHGLPTNTGGSWYLYGPNNEYLGNAGFNGDFEVVTTPPGRYLLLLYGNSSSPIPVNLQVFIPDSGAAGSGLAITSIEATSGGVTLVWAASSGQKYRVQYKATLSQAGWTDLAGDVTASSTSAAKTDNSIGADSLRYYQVETAP